MEDNSFPWHDKMFKWWIAMLTISRYFDRPPKNSLVTLYALNYVDIFQKFQKQYTKPLNIYQCMIKYSNDNILRYTDCLKHVHHASEDMTYISYFDKT